MNHYNRTNKLSATKLHSPKHLGYGGNVPRAGLGREITDE